MKVCCRLQKVQSVPGLLSGIVATGLSGIYANSCLSFLEMCDSLSIDNHHKRFLISKIQPTTSSAAEINHGTTLIYSTFNVHFFCFVFFRFCLFSIQHLLFTIFLM